jgi:hypothetical protein
MSRAHDEETAHPSRVHGQLMACGRVWNVRFVDILRDRHDWLVECEVEGPTIHRVTIRCTARMGPGETSRRIMASLREWLAADDRQRRAWIEVPYPVQEAC